MGGRRGECSLRHPSTESSTLTAFLRVCACKARRKALRACGCHSPSPGLLWTAKSAHILGGRHHGLGSSACSLGRVAVSPAPSGAVIQGMEWRGWQRQLSCAVLCVAHARRTLLAQLDHCVTPSGRKLLRRWLVRPLLSGADIRARQDAVEDIKVRPQLPWRDPAQPLATPAFATNHKRTPGSSRSFQGTTACQSFGALLHSFSCELVLPCDVRACKWVPVALSGCLWAPATEGRPLLPWAGVVCMVAQTVAMDAMGTARQALRGLPDMERLLARIGAARYEAFAHRPRIGLPPPAPAAPHTVAWSFKGQRCSVPACPCPPSPLQLQDQAGEERRPRGAV